jgi:hypothetical protein
MTEIQVVRIGFERPSDYSQKSTPEDGLDALLKGMEKHGHTIVSVSVLRCSSDHPHQSYEAYIVSRWSRGKVS